MAAALVLLQLAPASLRAAAMLLLAFWALGGARRVIQALSVGVLVMQANSALAEGVPDMAMLRWILLFAAFLRLALFTRGRHREDTGWKSGLLVFAGTVAALALAVSGDVLLSLFKLGSFAAGVAIILWAYERADVEPRYWLNWFYTLYCVVTLFNAPLLFTSAGYDRNGWAFQGMLSHPQSLGVYVMPMTAYLIFETLTKRRFRLFPATMALLNCYFLAASNCRTAAMAAVAAGLAVALTGVLARQDILDRILNPTAIGRASVAAFALVIVISYDSAGAANSILSFLTKHSEASEDSTWSMMAGSVKSSRGVQLERSLETIATHPVAGVGFGRAAVGVEQVVLRDPILGLPVGAPTEHGFLPLGLLTEVGVIGSLAFVVLFAKMSSPVVRLGTGGVCILFWSTVLLNLGEMVFFAMGDLGLHVWLTLGLCHFSGVRARLAAAGALD